FSRNRSTSRQCDEVHDGSQANNGEHRRGPERSLCDCRSQCRAVNSFVTTLSEKREKRSCSRAQRRPRGLLRIGLPLWGSRFHSRNPCENPGKTATFYAYSRRSQCCKPRCVSSQRVRPAPRMGRELHTQGLTARLGRERPLRLLPAY